MAASIIALDRTNSILNVLGSLQLSLKQKSYEQLLEVMENVVQDVSRTGEEKKRKQTSISVSVSLFVGQSTIKCEPFHFSCNFTPYKQTHRQTYAWPHKIFLDPNIDDIEMKNLL